MTKKIYISLILVFGFALTPNITFACGTKSEKSCCKKNTSKKQSKKDCCKKSKNHSNEKDDCGGKCGNKSCQCPAPNLALTIPTFFEISNKNYDFSDEKQKFHHFQIFLSSGFYSIWTPPNIG
jgi:hypothetical protein